jgi:tRNA (guanine37-N1)-methyltransferase
MKINLITLFPEFFKSPLSVGVLSGAIEKGSLSLATVNPRQFTTDVHHSVDDRPFGGGDGMVMKLDPLTKAMEFLGENKGHVVALSPSGRVFNAEIAKEYSKLEVPLTLICGRYAGIDQRFIELFCDEELSVGDFVLSGGEPAALSVIDSVARLLPGVLGNAASPEGDSFFSKRLECPSYTRPRDFLDLEVPPVLLSGDHKKILEFQNRVSLLRTHQRRPDLLSEKDAKELTEALRWAKTLSESERKVLGLKELINE